jgi:hypothetical protein
MEIRKLLIIIYFKKKVDKINRELSGLAHKLLSLWPWEPV